MIPGEPGDPERGQRIASNYFDLAHGHGLLGTAPAQPPHRGDHDVVRRPRVRAAAGRRGARRRGRPARAARAGDAGRRPGPGPRRLRRRRAQDEQRGRRRDPRRRRRRRGPGRTARRLRHRDRDVVRTAARPGLADRHDGPQRAQGRRPRHARRARAGASRCWCAGHRRRRRRRAADRAVARRTEHDRPRGPRPLRRAGPFHRGPARSSSGCTSLPSTRPRTRSPAGGWSRPGCAPGRTPPATSAAAARAARPGCRRCCSARTSTPSRTPVRTTACSAW